MTKKIKKIKKPKEADIPLKSVAIERLIKEVRDEKSDDKPWGGYNRTYHRHNR